MRIEITTNGVRLVREAGDKALSHESAATFHLRRLLRVKTGRRFVRFWPCREGLTDCRQGVIDRAGGACYWHGDYQVEAAHKAFNAGGVFFNKA